MPGQTWTQEEIKILSDMARRHLPVEEMQRVLKARSYNGIRNKLLILKLKAGPTPEIDLAEFRRLMGGK